MSPVVAWLGSPLTTWVLLAAPGAWLTFGYSRGSVFYGEFVHATGDWSIWLIIAALCVTPLRLFFRGARFTDVLVRRRRFLGVAACGYALLHTIAWVQRQVGTGAGLADAADLSLLPGWVALALMLVLAATSNDYSVRHLGRRWKALHRTVYLASALVIAHWILTAFDPTTAWVHAGFLAALLLSRPLAPLLARFKAD